MLPYKNPLNYRHSQLPRTGVLITNLGTPDEPTTPAVRRYLAEFLADPRVTEMPRWLWMLILHGIILRVRPRRSALKYQKIWTAQGSPLLTISQQQQAGIQQRLSEHFSQPVQVALGMRYGQPSIVQALESFRAQSIQRLIVLPLYPQYASAVTASTFDAVTAELTKWRWLPDLRFITHYPDHPAYIQALVARIRGYWAAHGTPDKLLFSFHGMPQRFFTSGDPYFCECHKTARLVAEAMQLPAAQWSVCFQSRFGKEEWIKPYTDHVLQQLGREGTRRVDVVCAGFSADCLETLEEIDQENRELFLHAGGKEFHYIPALNAMPEHLDALSTILQEQMQGCWGDELNQSLADARVVAGERVERAEKMGAGE